MPPVKLLRVLIIRKPLDIVSNHYDSLIHGAKDSKDAPVGQMMSYLMKIGAGDRSRLEALGVFDHGSDIDLDNITYTDYLRTLPETKGLQLDLVRLGPDLWRMARLYSSLLKSKTSLHDTIVIRYEDLLRDFKKALAPLSKKLRTRCMTGLLEWEMVEYMSKICIKAEISLDEEKKLKRRQRQLRKDNQVNEEVKLLEVALGYTP